MKQPRLSKRALDFPQSPIRSLEPFVQQALKNKIKIIKLNVGAPDTEVPKKIRISGTNFLKKNKSIPYGPTLGNYELREKLVGFYKEKLKIKGLSPENLLITQGGNEALGLAFYSVAQKGEKILTPDPTYANYKSLAYRFGVKLKPIPTQIKNGFHLIKKGESINRAVKRLSQLVDKKTKAIVYSSPGNPTGAVFGLKELKLIKKLAFKHNLFIIADEVYRLLTFENGVKIGPFYRARSILDIADKSERKQILVIDSSSKMLGFCGGRIGFMWADEKIVRHVMHHTSCRGCPNVIAQEGLLKINQVENNYFDKNLEQFKKRRNFLFNELKKLKSIGLDLSPQPPEGAFYLVVGLRKNIRASHFCRWLLTDYPKLSKEEETIFLAPMKMGRGGFYLKNTGLNQVRIAYVLSIPKLKKAVSILKKAIKFYKIANNHENK